MKYLFLLIMGIILLVIGALSKGALQTFFVMAACIIECSLLTYFIITTMIGRDISAKQEIFIPFHADHIPRKKIKETLEAIGCKIVRDQKTDIEADMGFSILSWGETISVTFVDNGMKVQSKCSSPVFIQAIDWGKNRKNLKRFEIEWKKREALNP
jgi:hypothetical protein